MKKIHKSEIKLTADIVRVTKGCGDFRIKFYHKIVLFREVIVAILNLVGYPLSEVVSNDRIYHVDDPLPW